MSSLTPAQRAELLNNVRDDGYLARYGGRLPVDLATVRALLADLESAEREYQVVKEALRLACAAGRADADERDTWRRRWAELRKHYHDTQHLAQYPGEGLRSCLADCREAAAILGEPERG